MSRQKKNQRPKPIVLMILEGWGVAPAHPGNAITEAAPEYFNYLLSHYPAITLSTPEIATAENGHAMIGLGRRPSNPLLEVNEKISTNTFKNLPVLKQALAAARRQQLHIVVLLSNAEQEASFAHLEALLAAAAGQKLKPYIHVILDGRDTTATAGKELVAKLETVLATTGGRIASVMGRVYGLDQTNHTERTDKALKAIVNGEGASAAEAASAIADYYDNKIFDEEVPPTVIVDETSRPVATLTKEDTIIFANFSGASLRQLVGRLLDVMAESKNIFSLTDYGFEAVRTLVGPVPAVHTLGNVIASAHLRQLRLSTSEGFADVTCFLNGGACPAAVGEERLLIPDSVSEKPEERGDKEIEALGKALVKAVEEKNHDIIIATFSALDRVAHAADVPSAVRIVTAIDNVLKRSLTAVLETGGVAIVTSSHGLAENTVLPLTSGFAAHTAQPVPFLLIGKQFAGYSLRFPQAAGGDLSLLSPVGSLADVAPTMLQLAGLDIPSEMTGRSLIDAS